MDKKYLDRIEAQLTRRTNVNQELDIHRQHAAERLRADTMEQRWQAKTKECNALRDIIAKLNEQLSDCMTTTQHWASLAGTNSVDAERYRWLRNQNIFSEFGGFSPYVVQGQTMEMLEGEEVDKAVDNELAKDLP